MTSYTTTSYGTWCNQVSPYSTSPDSDVLDFINGGDNDWQRLLSVSGALDQILSEYRIAIDAALPDSVALSGDEFNGPAYPDDSEFDGYPTDEYGDLDIKACVEGIDLQPIIERNEPLTLADIGRWELKSQAKNPAKSASSVMAKLGLKPFAYVACGDSTRPQAIYLAGPVRDALAKRPGQGARKSA